MTVRISAAVFLFHRKLRSCEIKTLRFIIEKTAEVEQRGRRRKEMYTKQEIRMRREQAEEIRHTQEWKEIYLKRKETIERVFADCKENNGLRYTRLRGLKKNQQNAWLIFACHNLKKVAIWRSLC